jgi:CS domain
MCGAHFASKFEAEEETRELFAECTMDNGQEQQSSCSTDELRKSALQDNLEKKGKNAYYFAHAHKATGPAWDGQPEPKLLSRHTTNEGHKSTQAPTFDYAKSNITTYAFLDDGAKVKVYIDMEDVGEKCSDDDVDLDFTERSLSFSLSNYKDECQILCFGKLTAEISAASYRIKKDKIIITLTKVDPEKKWHTINDKGAPDHELV